MKVLEDALTRIDDRVGKLVSDLDATTEKIVNQLTGGDSYCRFMIEKTALRHDRMQLMAIHEGDFPLYDLQARIVDLQKLESLKGNLTLDNFREADTTLNLGTLNPRMAMPSAAFSLAGFDRHSYNVFFTARNGTFTQLIRLCRKDGKWVSADKVQRDNGDVLWYSDDERRSIVLPVLVRDCSIPMFLREKLYADFRTDFDEGLSTILESVAKVTNEWRNRLEEPTWHTDWSIDWGQTDDGIHILRLTLVEAAESQPYTVLTVISLLPAEPSSNEWYDEMTTEGKDDDARRHIVESLSAELTRLDVRVMLEDQFEKATQIPFDTDHGQYLANITTRWLGMDTGRDVLFNTAQQIDGIKTQMQLAAARPTDSE